MIKNTLGIQKELFDLLKPFDWKSMVELGNKTVGPRNHGVPFKTMFESQGIQHISIDLNGRDGALPFDLSKPIHMPTYDILTNYGTSEHILDGQEQVFRNIHNLSHYRIIHAVPRVGSYPHHGYWHFDKDFFLMLADLNDYQIDQLFIIGPKGRELVCCSYTKLVSNFFKWDDSLPMHYNTTTRGTVIQYA